MPRIPEKFKRLKVKLIPVYKKISIASPNFFVQFKPGQLLDETGTYGFLDERSGENVQLMDQLNTLKAITRRGRGSLHLCRSRKDQGF